MVNGPCKNFVRHYCLMEKVVASSSTEVGNADLSGHFMPAFCATQTTSAQPQSQCSPDGTTTSQLVVLIALVQKQQEQLDQITQALAAM